MGKTLAAACLFKFALRTNDKRPSRGEHMLRSDRAFVLLYVSAAAADMPRLNVRMEGSRCHKAFNANRIKVPVSWKQFEPVGGTGSPLFAGEQYEIHYLLPMCLDIFCGELANEVIL